MEIDDELSAIDHLEDYTLLVLLHHHVYPIDKAHLLKPNGMKKHLLIEL